MPEQPPEPSAEQQLQAMTNRLGQVLQDYCNATREKMLEQDDLLRSMGDTLGHLAALSHDFSQSSRGISSTQLYLVEETVRLVHQVTTLQTEMLKALRTDFERLRERVKALESQPGMGQENA